MTHYSGLVREDFAEMNDEEVDGIPVNKEEIYDNPIQKEDCSTRLKSTRIRKVPARYLEYHIE